MLLYSFVHQILIEADLNLTLFPLLLSFLALSIAEYIYAKETLTDRGSTPILRTLQRSLMIGKRSVYVEEKKV